MRILITNDDGIEAEGLIPFVRWAMSLGEVSVYAPRVEQSAKSHAINIHSSFEIKKRSLIPGVRAFAVDSTPADCVRCAVLGFKERYDLVLSGINRGYNMGGDILYSGTVSAAREAAYLGIPAVAVSTSPENYSEAYKELPALWAFFTANRLLEEHSLYNVNIPPAPQGIRITDQGGPYFSDDFDSLGGDIYKAHGKCVYEPGEELDIDTHCTLHGCISVNPLLVKSTASEVFSRLKEKIK